ncbi:MAG: response regulator [Chitinophagales bacterium]
MQPKILLVDDREDNLLSIEAILGAENYRFVKATSGKQALKVLLQEYDFALILMDVKMPNLNGFETASMIYQREKLKQIPIIFITAHSYTEESVYNGYKAGAVDYIYKPIKPELLRAKVAVFIDLYQKNHRLQMQEQKLMAINKSLENEINERKMSEEKIKALNLELLKNIDQLEAANKDLDRFAFMASHDLQEPLRKIRLFTDRLFSGYNDLFDDNGKMYINRIQSSAERMQVLIRDILTFSKAATAKKEYVKCDVGQLVKEVLDQLEETIAIKGAIIDIDKMPHLFINPTLMRAVFYNLLNNALKYTREDVAPVIKIRTEASISDVEVGEDGRSLYTRILIEDNGIGFDQRYAEQIFSMFTRLHNSGDYEGTGIGLALCKKIIEDHQGFISARSKPGLGSTFVISLPVNLQQVAAPTSNKTTAV